MHVHDGYRFVRDVGAGEPDRHGLGVITDGSEVLDGSVKLQDTRSLPDRRMTGSQDSCSANCHDMQELIQRPGT